MSKVAVHYIFTFDDVWKKSGPQCVPRVISVERDTRLAPSPHSTLKPFFSKTRFRRVRHWYSEGAIRLSSSLQPLSGKRLVSVSLSLSLSLSLVGRRSEFGSTKSPPRAHAPCPANNDDETPRCASSSATGRAEREVSTCPVTLVLAASLSFARK